MEQEMVDSVVQEIYNNLSVAWCYNKKAKLNNRSSSYFYADKANIIVDSIKKIVKNDIKDIKYYIQKDKFDENLIIVRFRFYNEEFKDKGFSFHLPSFYKNLINNNLKEINNE